MALKFVADETLRVVDASIIPEWCTRGRPCAKISTNRVTVTAPARGCWIVRIGRWPANARGGVIIIRAAGSISLRQYGCGDTRDDCGEDSEPWHLAHVVLLISGCQAVYTEECSPQAY
jgi:hypothetical protein